MTINTEAQCWGVVISVKPEEVEDPKDLSCAVGYMTEKGVEVMKAKLLALGFTSEWTPLGKARGYYFSPSYYLQMVRDGL